MMHFCIICSSRSDLMSVELNAELSQLFQDITNIEVKDEIASATGNAICSECIDKLKDISSFIQLSLCNDKKLEFAVERKKDVKCETYSSAIGIDSSTSNGLKSENVAENNEVMKGNPFEKTISEKIEEKQENIDIRGHIFETEHSNSLSRTYRAELATGSQKSTPKLFPMQDSLIPAEEEFSQCVWSNKNFTHTRDSRRQMITNTKEKLKCDLCGKIFIRKSIFQSHLLICTGERQFKCDYCEKSFKQRGCLKAHFRIHTGERPSECYYCKKRFNRKGELKIHLRTHTGEKPFKCDCCEKSFSRKGDLKIHLRTHSGEKCDICGKSFSEKSDLGAHMMRMSHWREAF